MAITQIRGTANYGQFELHTVNRNVERTKYLERSMRTHGWIDAYPMYVIRNGNNKFDIIDGHHRFEVAKSLKLPVKFVVCRQGPNIHETQRSTRVWSISDYLTSYVRAGFPVYAAVKDYHEKTGIPLNCCIGLLAGQLAHSGKKGDVFKSGAYSLGDRTCADIVGDIVIHCRKHGIDWAANHLFVQALSRVAIAAGFDPGTLKKKIKNYPFMLQKKANVEAYLTLIEEVYNWRSTTKIPLRFLADEAARKRSAIQPKANDKGETLSSGEM